MKALLSDRNIGLNTAIIELLERIGELELEQPELEPGILQSIAQLISDSANRERWGQAYGIFGQQFDGPYSDTYYQVVQGLPSDHRKSLYEMAAKGAEYPDLFLSVLLLDLAAFNDLRTEAGVPTLDRPAASGLLYASDRHRGVCCRACRARSLARDSSSTTRV